MKWKQRLFSLLLCGVMLFSLCTPAAAVEESGNFDNGSWTLDDSGTLTITCTAAGNVPMPDFASSNIPWKSQKERITSVVFSSNSPGHFTSIGDSAFWDCTNLTEIRLPEGVTSIGLSAFASCKSLMTIELPESLISIREYAFYECENLTAIELPEGLTSIEGCAFYGCKKLTAINLPESVTSIGVCAFLLCESLSAIELPEGLISIEDSTFKDCKSLTTIKLPKSLTSIGDSAFYGCTSLTAIKLPEGLISIGEYAFRDCTSLTAIDLPETVTSIGDSAFHGCTSFTAMNLPDGVTSIGRNIFEGCKNLTEITLPESLESIGDEAFYGCTSLETVRLPEGLSSIGYQAYYKCTSLGSITLPGSLRSIGEYAFDGCTGLTSVTFTSETPPTLGGDVFYGCDALTEIRVPAGKEGAYSKALTDDGLSADSVTVKGGYPVTVTAGEGGTASASPDFAAEREDVTLTATANSGHRFNGWTVNAGGVTLADASGATTTFPMPAQAVTVTANFESIPTQTYLVTVNGGTGGGSYATGATVTITATVPSGQRFTGWTVNAGGVTLADANSAATTFTMLAQAVTVTANFQNNSSGGSYTPPKKDEPQTGSSGGWKDIQKELEGLEPGDDVDVTMNGATEVPKEVLEGIAGKDVNVNFDMGGGIVWTVNGKDIPSGIGSLNLGIRTGSSSIPVSVFNAITGEKSTMQFTLAHSGPFGTVLHLSLNLGTANRGYWANLYWFDESSKELVFQHSCRIDSEGKASWPFDHASSYAVVIDEKNHDPAWENPFADVSEGDWYYEAVRFIHERGLMNGYADGRFAPEDTLSRAQLAQILFNKEGRPGVNYLLDFSDVAGEAWYTEAIRWATSQGIVGGYGNGTFGPNDPITREQLAVMLWRYVGSPAATNKELRFNDTDEISPFALEALRWAVENGILNGCGDGRLGPQGQATRAQVAQMLMNFMEAQGKNA